MLKHADIIEKLTAEQKTALAASLDALSDPRLQEAGIPRVQVGKGADCATETFPSYAALANSWNTALMKAAAEAQAAAARQAGVNLLYTPSLRLRSDPYQKGLTEDPYLGDVYARAIAEGYRGQGVMPCLSGASLNAVNVAYLDKQVSKRALSDYFLRPFSLFTEGGACAAESDCTRLSGSYDRVNEELFGRYLRTPAAADAFVLCSHTDHAAAMRVLAAGELLADGEAGWLSKANGEYRRMKEAVYRGERGIDELDRACARGEALSDEALDEAADRAVSLAFACAEAASRPAKPPQDMARSAAEESVVLLKNAGVLPLWRNCRVAVAGKALASDGTYFDEAFAAALRKRKRYAFVGSAAGYHAAEERSDRLLSEALAAVRKADAVVVFLDGGMSERSVKMPANRVALVAALAQQGKRVIVVLTGGVSPDMSFDRYADAVLLAPTDGAFCAQALCDVISGTLNPSGRLAATCYSDPDAVYASIRMCKETGRNRVGTFIGYRRYQTAGVKVRYPFGFGLNYTRFDYRSLKIEGDAVSFTVKNTGGRAGSEVVQVYTGKRDSALLRPARELKMFAKIHLKAGESKRVSFRLDPRTLAFGVGGRAVTEGGDYEIYVGASVADIRLRGTMHVEGRRIAPSGEKPEDYFQTASNILSGGYTFGDVLIVKEKFRHLRFASLLFAFFMAALALAMVIVDVVGVEDVWTPGWPLAVFIASAAFAVGGIAAYLIGRKLRAVAEKRAAVIREAEMKGNENAGQSYEALFDELFDDLTMQTETPAEQEDGKVSSREALAYDPVRTAKTVCGELVAFCTERGVAISERTAAKALASFAASRLIFLKCSDGELEEKFLSLLCAFFGAPVYADEYNGCENAAGLLYTGEGREAREDTNVGRAVKEAAEQRSKIVPAIVKNVQPAQIASFFMPFARYINFPESEEPVIFKEGEGEKESVFIPPNVWFVFTFAPDAELLGTDAYAANLAIVCGAELSAVEEREEKTPVSPLGYGQLRGIVRAARDEFWLDEDRSWKKVDKAEAYAHAHGGYVIDNKCFVRMEKYSSVLLACGAAEAETLDCTAAAKLVLPVCVALNGKSDELRGFSEAAAAAFGEENSMECRKAIGELRARDNGRKS